MSDRLRESVSALMDGEADDLELRRVLAAADQAEVRSAWRDYHLQREALNGGDLRFAEVDLSRGIWAAIAQDDVAEAPAQAQQTGKQESVAARWLRPVASLAVAASVAAIVVVGVRGLDGNSAESAAPSLADVRPSAVQLAPAAPLEALPPTVESGIAVAAPVAGTAMTVSAGDEMAQSQLEQHLQEHVERAAGSGQGLINFARVPELDAE